MGETKAIIPKPLTKAVDEIRQSEISKQLVIDYLEAFGLSSKLTGREKHRFLGICQAFGLNPFKREIYCTKYGNDMSIITGYEVYLKRAENTGLLEWWKVKTEGDEATVTIKRKDWTEPFEWTVDREEYDLRRALWKTKPKFMLKKVAIATGFRLLFPEDLGGMPYTSDEIAADGQQDDYIPVQVELKPEPRYTPPEFNPSNSPYEMKKDLQRQGKNNGEDLPPVVNPPTKAEVQEKEARAAKARATKADRENLAKDYAFLRCLKDGTAPLDIEGSEAYKTNYTNAMDAKVVDFASLKKTVEKWRAEEDAKAQPTDRVDELTGEVETVPLPSDEDDIPWS